MLESRYEAEHTTGTYKTTPIYETWNGMWMHDTVGWAWASPHAECGPVARMRMTAIRMWLNLRPQNITQKVHTCTTQELWVRPS